MYYEAARMWGKRDARIFPAPGFSEVSVFLFTDGQQLLPRPPSSANKYMKYNYKYNENFNGLVFCTLSACVASDIRLKVSNFPFTLYKKE